jgi:hypothetical protein
LQTIVTMADRQAGSSSIGYLEGPGAAPFEGDGGTDPGPPHETTPNAEQDEDDSGTGANNQEGVQRPDRH